MTENVIIIGGGPAGLSAAIYNARANLKPLLFAGSPPGGQLVLTSEVENYPGLESVLGPDLIEKMKVQAVKFGTRVVNENIVNLDFSKRPFTVYTSRETYESHAILIATGAKALWLGLESETRLRGKGVSACATCDGFFFRDKTVAVIGGGDTAMEEALTLTKFASKVYIIHRRNEFRASKIMQERVLTNPKVEIIYNAVVEEIIGEKRVEGIRLKKSQIPNPKSQKNSKSKIQNYKHLEFLPLDGLFIAIGHKPDTEVFSQQIELDEKGYVITLERRAVEVIKSQITNPPYRVNKSQMDSASSPYPEQSRRTNSRFFGNWKLEIGNYRSSTSVPGVFAAGDCVDHIYRQVATAVGMGVAAALDIEKYLEIRNSDLSKN